MLAPAAPHITEELWAAAWPRPARPWTSIHTESWPEVDIAAIAEATREVPVQVNGKLRDKVIVPSDITPRHRGGRARARTVVAALDGRTPDRIVVAGGGKLVNLVIRD